MRWVVVQRIRFNRLVQLSGELGRELGHTCALTLSEVMIVSEILDYGRPVDRHFYIFESGG